MNETTDNSLTTVSDLNPFGSREALRSILFADCLEVDGSYTTGASLFAGDQDATDTYAWALGPDEAQAGVRCGDGPSTCQKCFVQARSERVWSVPRGGQCKEEDKNKKRNRVRRRLWGDGEPYPYPPRDNRRPPGSGSLQLSTAGPESGEVGDEPSSVKT
ncbi:hypothetical protein B0I37DRAFT_41746 [Chaetomium sp. MPI-CAGE-AT-0009]|nr:hypothetical protein B0I37DRAFT_41746 [Chaetomium sp. MPI-CAGE-AT-0009]